MATEALPVEPKAERTFAIQSIARAVDLLHCFRTDQPELGVSELSRRLGLHKSTVCRLLQSLEAADFVRQNQETGRYALGFALVKLAGLVLDTLPVREIAQPSLMRLAQASSETVNLAVFNRHEVVNIVQIPSRQSIKHLGWLGRCNPLHCTSGGKIALAHLSPAEVASVLSQPLPRYTPHTLTDPGAIQEEIATVRARGYAVAQDEFEEGLTAIAAPVLDYAGRLAAIVGISGPTFRMPQERIASLLPLLQVATRAISAEMGYAQSG